MQSSNKSVAGRKTKYSPTGVKQQIVSVGNRQSNQSLEIRV